MGFRKKTDTGVLLNFNAMVPNVWKVGLIRCMLNTGKRICSTEGHFNNEVHKLRKVFTSNGYPRVFFNQVYDKFITSLTRDRTTDGSLDTVNADKKEIRYTFGIPFVGTPSREYMKKIKELIKNHLEVDIFAYSTSCKVVSFFSLKSKTPFPLKARVIYKFKCLSDSDKTYIGKTERHIATRAKEHLTPKTANTVNPSAVVSHISNCETCKTGPLSVDHFSIVKQCKNDYRCKINEALVIKKCNPVLNKQSHNRGQSYLLRVF